MEPVLVYVTAANTDAARRMARIVVEERLAACANILNGMTAIYRWNGALQEEHEAVLLLKTASDRQEALIARLRDLHEYEVPCIVAIPITAGNPDFLRWIEAETRGIEGLREIGVLKP